MFQTIRYLNALIKCIIWGIIIISACFCVEGFFVTVTAPILQILKFLFKAIIYLPLMAKDLISAFIDIVLHIISIPFETILFLIEIMWFLICIPFKILWFIISIPFKIIGFLF